MKITNIEYQETSNAGCNNGNYIPYTVTFDNGEVYESETCRCGNGCSGTDRTNHLEIGMEFANWDEFVDSLQ